MKEKIIKVNKISKISNGMKKIKLAIIIIPAILLFFSFAHFTQAVSCYTTSITGLTYLICDNHTVQTYNSNTDSISYNTSFTDRVSWLFNHGSGNNRTSSWNFWCMGNSLGNSGNIAFVSQGDVVIQGINTTTATYKTLAAVNGATSNPISVNVACNYPVSVNFTSANPVTIGYHSNFSLNWTSAHADSCTGTNLTGDGSVQNIPTSGSYVMTNLTAPTYNYSVTCTGAGGKTVVNGVIHVTQPPPTCTSFTYSDWSPSVCPSNGQQTRSVASSSPSGCVGGTPTIWKGCANIYSNPNTVAYGNSSAISWNAPGADTIGCKLTADNNSQQTNCLLGGGTWSSTDNTCTLSGIDITYCDTYGGAASDEGSYPCEFGNFTQSQCTSNHGSWSSPECVIPYTDSYSCLSNGGVPLGIASSCAVPASNISKINVSPNGWQVSSGPLYTPTTFTLSCLQNLKPYSTASTTVGLADAPIINIWADPTYVVQGQSISTTINWNSTKADSCQLSKLAQPFATGTAGSISSGPIVYNPTEFDITCSSTIGAYSHKELDIPINYPTPVISVIHHRIIWGDSNMGDTCTLYQNGIAISNATSGYLDTSETTTSDSYRLVCTNVNSSTPSIDQTSNGPDQIVSSLVNCTPSKNYIGEPVTWTMTYESGGSITNTKWQWTDKGLWSVPVSRSGSTSPSIYYSQVGTTSMMATGTVMIDGQPVTSTCSTTTIMGQDPGTNTEI